MEGTQTYVFNNRRRAKDVIIHIAHEFGTNGVTVFVREGMVYVSIANMRISPDDIKLLMYYAEPCDKQIEAVLSLEDITELYRGIGILKFRV